MEKSIVLLCILTSLSLSVCSFSNRSIEEECKACTLEGNKMFIKIIHYPFSRAEYVCRDSALLVSKFGIIADRSCTPEQCFNITNRPVMRTFTRHELFCEDSDFSPNGNHIQILTIVKDYLEIILMSVMIGLLVLKKSLIESCFRQRFNQLFNPQKAKESRTFDVENQNSSPFETIKL